jgi:hypothetical protein
VVLVNISVLTEHASLPGHRSADATPPIVCSNKLFIVSQHKIEHFALDIVFVVEFQTYCSNQQQIL